MGKKITDLTTDASPDLTAEVETERDGASWRMTLQAIKDLFGFVGGGGDPDMPQGVARLVTNSFTWQLTDANKIVKITLNTNSTMTLPNDATVNFPVGTRLFYTIASSAGTINSSLGAGVTLHGLAAGGNGGNGVLIKMAANTWFGRT